MTLDNIHNVYFLGIGGIGMSALARWFGANGYVVSGYDRTVTELTQKLEGEGIEVHYDDDVVHIPEAVMNDPTNTLVVYTPAIPKDHKEYNYLVDKNYTIMKRSEVLGHLTHSMFTVAVAGTHGKTTTSSMIAHLLRSAGKNCTAFVGGIMTNYDTNLIIGDKKDDAIMVVEADEFDRSFLTLHPDVAVITAVDADHLDIYGTAADLQDSFRAFIDNIKARGQLFIEESAADKINLKNLDHLTVTTYGLSRGDISAESLGVEDARFTFDYHGDQLAIDGLSLGLPGYHNVENAVAAISVVHQINMDADIIREGVQTYVGVKRRFEYVLREDNLTFIDDYAHHPRELEALISSVRKLLPGKRITAVFQPHLYTRTRDFAEGFSQSLDLADEVILLDIYPARELPIEGVTSAMLLEGMQLPYKELCSKENLLKLLANKELEVLLTIGAGDIDKLVQPIKELLQERV